MGEAPPLLPPRLRELAQGIALELRAIATDTTCGEYLVVIAYLYGQVANIITGLTLHVGPERARSAVEDCLLLDGIPTA